MRNARPMLALALTAGLAVPARSAASAGAEAFDFLLFDAGARSVALGGAYTALAADSNALLYNPAGLGFVEAHEATFMHNKFVQGLTQDYAAYASPQGFGAQLNYVSLGNVARTTIDMPDGAGSSFGVSDLALAGGYGRVLADGVSVGVGAKYFRETIDAVSFAGYAADAGVLARPSSLPGLTLGASLLNFGPNARFLTVSEPLPTTGRLGAAYAFDLFGQENIAAFDASKTRSDRLRFGFGFETVLQKQFALRAGFTTRNDAGLGLTGGVGWRGETLAADYALVPFGDLGLTHRFSVTVRWGKAARAATRPRDAAAGRDLFDAVDKLIAQKKYEEALRSLDKLSASGSLTQGLRIVHDERRGTIQRLQGDCDAALRSYVDGAQLALDQKREDSVAADIYVGLGLCFATQNRDELAARSLRKGLKIGATPSAAALAREQLKRLTARSAQSVDGGADLSSNESGRRPLSGE